ncbi:hypothetical protein H257_05856 [Aphanomyces astaci]|uniref:tRNA (carboxymethyluridine(34)-5-O)-methyltransferase n=1 Tax=Aphanomyces astaci TaxID=112090 RepID=W4GPN9_APHAT|nr:hypothetical protein H257_05856 [Aphanomyces astaci]ETV81296.1 hypothetical protein H257_05856 [Aphanomyces astaci]|eukprot:XP_009829154.1 hypothetical protein H257_05856 [Aphanomyces astaci]
MSLTIADFLKASSTEASAHAGTPADTGLTVSGLTHQQKLPSATPYLSLTWSKKGKKFVVTDQTLVDILSVYGPVKQVIMGTGSRKTAIVEFERVKDAQVAKQALDDSGAVFHGKKFHVEPAMLRKAFEDECSFNRVPNYDSARRQVDPATFVPGLLVYNDFITPEQETLLLAELDKAEWKNDVRARQVQHFGYVFNYKTQKCDASTPLEDMPPFCRSLIDTMPPTFDGVPDQITANEYLPGQGISAHIDTHSAFTGSIGTLSLGHASVMEFRHPEDGRCETFLLEPRALYIMTGASRYQWTHCVHPRLFDVVDGAKVPRRRRVSITFRKLQATPCTCAYPDQCDSQQYTEATTSTEKMSPTEIEQRYVHDFYETIAEHFSSTRHSPWPRVEAFVRGLPLGTLVADIGCGNGKYMKCVGTPSGCVGGDRSESLVKICKSRDLNVLVLDALVVPLRSNAFDVALSIAVLHHLSTLAHRLQAVKEVLRVLRVGGQGLIYAWAQEQTQDSRRAFDSHKQDCMVPWNLDKRFAKVDADSGEPVVVQRYCHMFKEGELDSLVRMSGNAVVNESYYDQDNWAIRFTKTSDI